MRSPSVALALIPALVWGSSLTPRTLAERARGADRVAVVQVLSTWTEVPGGDVRRMRTHTEVLVGDVLKGPGGPRVERLTITQLGGKHGLWESHVPGDATFVPGETALVLLKCSRSPTECGLVGLAEGKVTFVGGEAFVFDLASKRHVRRPAADVLAELKRALPAPATGAIAR